MTDIAQLAIRIDSTSAKSASTDLDKLSKQSERTEQKVDQFSKNSSKSLSFLKTGIAGVATAFAAIGGAQIVRGLTNSALAMDRITNSLTAATGSSSGAARELAFVREEANRLGLNLETTASQYAKLTAAARGTATEGKSARDIFVAISQASTVLGLSAEQTGGALTAIEQIISKGTVSSEELRGQLGERLPGAFQIAARSMNVTTQELGKMLQAGSVLAEDLLPAMAEEINKTFAGQAIVAAEGLNAQLNRMETGFFDLRVAVADAGVSDFFRESAGAAASFFTTFSSAITSAITDSRNFGGAISDADAKLKVLTDKAKMQEWGDQIARVSAFIVDSFRSVGIVFDVTGKTIGATIARIEALLSGDFAGSKAIGKSFTEDFNSALESMGKMQNAVEDQITIRNSLATSTKNNSEALERNTAVVSSNEEATKKAKKALSDAEKEMNKMRDQVERLTLQHDPLARMNSELAELVDLRNKAGLSDEIFDLAATESINKYVKSLEKVNEETKTVDKTTQELKETGHSAFESMSQFAIQGARDIQSAMSAALLDGIDGFKSFSKSVLDIIKRLAANIASVKILEGLGVGGLLGFGSSSALASSGSGISNLISGAGNIFSSGFGLNNLIGSGISSAGSFFGSGSLSAFGGGLSGGSSAAGVSTALLDGGASSAAAASGAAGLGSAVSAIAGPVVIAGILDQVGKLLAGNKTTGTFIDKVPVIGGFASALFGRGPLKQKDSLIRGNVTEQGISEDFLTATNFKAKGGLLRGDKVDRVIINANTGELVNGAPGLPESGISKELLPFAGEASQQAVQIGQVFDLAVKSFDASLRSTGETLGLNSNKLDNFQRYILLTAQNAEGVTETQVAEEIANIGDHMANVLLPGLQDMRKGGESAIQALTRITQEFASLQGALVILGASSSEAQEALKGMSVASRIALIDQAGGLEAFGQQMNFFASNFLTAQEHVELAFNSVDAEMKKIGLSANITKEEFAELVKSVTKAGGVTAETAIELLKIAPAFINLKNSQEALAQEALQTSSRVDGLTSSVSGLGDEAAQAAAELATNIQNAFARIDTARAGLDAAEKQRNVAIARRSLSDAQDRLSIANTAVANAESDLAAARNAEQSSQQNVIKDQIEAITATVNERNELISLYEKEASSLKGLVDRFGALSKKILDFKDSLSLSELSPFSPGEQLAIARQQFNSTRNLAAQGNEDALAKLPEVSKSFLDASKIFNGATGAFESDFLFVQGVLESAGVTAKNARDIAADQLLGIESQIIELNSLNESSAQQVKALNDAAEKLGSIESNVLSVDQAMANLADAKDAQRIADMQVREANRTLEAEMFKQNGFIDDVGQATLLVRDSVDLLRDAVLQGFGNANISDQQIRDYVIANQGQSDQFFANAAVENNISGNQLKKALAPLGVTSERINSSTQGSALTNDQISSVVNQKLASGDFMGIYNLARANGVSSTRLASSSSLSKEEIDNFVRANNLQPFAVGTDFVKRDGIAMLHKGESVIPSSASREIKALREEIVQLRREQNQQMSALINTNIQANKENAQAIVKSNQEMTKAQPWINRSRARIV